MGDDCENSPECEPGDVKPGEGECFNCSCDMTGHWDCPDITCEPCVEGEMTGTECMECVCNERGTWSCTGFFDGMCGGPEECVPGETYPAGDGCNTCTCSMDGVLMCTMKFCGGMCAYGTVDCNADPSDGCETDTLTSVQNCGGCGVGCTAPVGQMAVCDEGVCVPGGLVCEVGRADCDGDVDNGCETDISSSPDNCGACGLVCMAAVGDTAVCNVGQCGLRGDPCWYRYEEYEIGEDFPARDGCNTCSCVDTETGSQVACTDIACECNPMSEANYRGYVSTDPVECMTADFPCPTYTTHFTNECGCGCEQVEDCPDTYPCAGDGSMDMMCAYLREHCPWSTAIVE
jgi:hypothetical protein